MAVGSGSVFAQESLRNALASDRIDEMRTRNFQNQNYNLKLGPVLVNTSANTGLTYNDNINLVKGAAQEDDVILRAGGTIGLLWQVTEYNRLALDTSVGYSYYINHPKFSRPEVNPLTSSDISDDFTIGAFRFNVHDRSSYTQNPIQFGSAAVQGVVDLGRFQNSAGLSGTFRMPNTTLRAGYDHANYLYFNNFFLNSNYASDMVYFSVGYQWNPALEIGWDVSGGQTDYEINVRPDNRNYTFGPSAKWQITESISSTARAGASGYQLISPSALGDTSSPLSYYLMVDVTHRANKWLQHSLAISHDMSQGIGLSANFIELLGFHYNAVLDIIPRIGTSVNLFYETSGDNSQGGSALLIRESFSRYGGGVNFSFRLRDRMNVTLAFQRTEKLSSLSQYEYTQNTVTLGLGYHF